MANGHCPFTFESDVFKIGSGHKNENSYYATRDEVSFEAPVLRMDEDDKEKSVLFGIFRFIWGVLLTTTVFVICSILNWERL